MGTKAQARHYRCKRCDHVFDAVRPLRGNCKCPKCGYGATVRVTFSGKEHFIHTKWTRTKERREAKRLNRKNTDAKAPSEEIQVTKTLPMQSVW